MKSNREIAQILLQCAQALLEGEKVEEPKKAKKAPDVDPEEPAEELTPEGKKMWTPRTRAKGRTPNFVLEMTGLKNKHEVVMAYGPTAVFVEGEPLPKKIGD